jgi:phosphohistidine phosphatase
LRKERLAPDLALVSAAKRTRQTWERVAAELGTDVEGRETRALYLAGPARILEAVRRAPAAAQRLMVVGHNPGMEKLYERLTGETRAFPTCALAIVTVDGDDWSALDHGTPARFIAP